MFDIGFWELSLIAVVALLVVGPDKLPGLARTVGLWIGKARRFVGAVQSDINRELAQADELKRLIEKQKEIIERHALIEDDITKELTNGDEVPLIPGTSEVPSTPDKKNNESTSKNKLSSSDEAFDEEK